MSEQIAVKKILVIRFSSLGDVVLSTAIFPNLRAKWPDAEISVLTRNQYAPVFDNNPDVDHVWVFSPKEQPFSKLAQEVRDARYDVIIDLHANSRSWILRFMASAPYAVVVEKSALARRALVWFKRSAASLKKSVREKILDCLKPLDVPVINTDTRLYPGNARSILETFNIDPDSKLIGIAPGAKHATKRWVAERFGEAATRLAAIPNTTVVVLGDKTDWAVADRVTQFVKAPCKNLAGWTSLPELVAVMSRLTLLLTNDSGLMHIAEALKIPLVAMFGPTVRQFGFAPYRETSRVVEVVNLPCRPCTLHGDERCPLGHHNCMKDLDVNAVLFTASSLLEAEPAGQVHHSEPDARSAGGPANS
jgi:heptosyltransferase-2